MSDEELKIESEHVAYWEECLNSLSKQFEIVLNTVKLGEMVGGKRITFTKGIKTNYINKSKAYKNEPSHIYVLTQIYFSFYSCLGNKMNDETKELLFNSITEIIQEINQTKKDTCNSTLKIINKCKNLIINIKNQENDFKKAKESLDNAQIYQKKIKNGDKYAYNVAKIQKADLLLSEKLKEMEKIKKPLEANKKKLNEYRSKLKSSIKNNFEIIVSFCFKQLSNYYQCLYLIFNQRIETLINVKAKLDDILIQLSNLVFDLNDYSEKKFGESILGIKTEGIDVYSSSELISKSSMKQLIEISTNIINYINIFLICLKNRKKIMKIFLETSSEINEFESQISNLFNDSKKDFINQLDSLKIINSNCQKYLRNLISKEKIGEIIKELNTIKLMTTNYIEFEKNEYETFLKNWESYQEKILERRKLSIDFLNEIKELKKSNKIINQNELIKRNEKKKNKLKQAIISALDFAQKNVLSTREKDKTEMMKLEAGFEKIFLNCQNINNEFISHMENELNNSVMTDIFEECKIFILKYFNRFKTQNYDKFLERMKIKLLINTDLSQGKLGRKIFSSITNGIENQIEMSKNDLSLDDTSSEFLSSEYFFRKSRRQSVYSNNNPFLSKTQINDNNNNSNIINKTNTMTNIDLSNVNNNNIINNTRLRSNSARIKINQNNGNIYKDNTIINEKDLTDIIDDINDEEFDEVNNLSDNQILNEMETDDKLNFVSSKQLTKYTEVNNPYSNIKEEELDRLLNLKEENSNKELDEDEKKLGSFNCSLSSEIISRGTFTITTKKIEYNSSFFQKKQIIIPLTDIVSIKKETSLGIDNSIRIKTEKVTYLFTSFLSRDLCFLTLKNQINKMKEENKNNEKPEEEKKDENSPEQKYLKRKRFKAKQVSKMLEEIEFYKKLDEFTKERMELFETEFRNEKKGFFMPQSALTRKYADITFEDCPLYIPFYILGNIKSKLEEYKSEKGFFESLFLERGDAQVKFQEVPEFSKTIPEYFNNGDYVMNLFSQFNKGDFENFLEEIKNWDKKYESTCYAIHKVVKIPFGPDKVVMKDRFVSYFISPTCLIIDDMAYATEFTYCDNFMPLFRYRFDCNLKFNEYKCKFEFKTKMTITYTTVFLVNFMLKSTVESQSNGTTEQMIKGEVLDKLKDSFNIYTGKFKDIFDRITDETFQRKLDLKQNMITGEIEEEVIDGLEDDENKQEEENNENKEENKEENNKGETQNNGTNKKISEFIDKYKTFIFIGIIVFIILGIIFSFFKTGSASIAVNTIFNLIILASIFYLYKFQ